MTGLHGSGRALLLASIGRSFPIANQAGNEVLVVWLPEGGEPVATASAVVSSQNCVATAVECLSSDGARTHHVDTPAMLRVLDGPGVSAEFSAFVLEAIGLDLTDFAPWLLWQLSEQAGSLRVEALLASRSRESGTTFARVSTMRLPVGATASEIYRSMPEFAPELVDSITMEPLNYFRLEKGTEIEVKIGLPANSSIWSLARAIDARVREGKLAGFIPDIGNELQRWQFAMHMYEVLEPESERGCISFSPNPSGSFMLHRKVFQRDGLRRQESPVHAVSVADADLERYLREHYPQLTLRRLPAFHRTRFDINIESTRTGHVFGIVIDEVTVATYGRKLQQVELEYFRSRVHEGCTAQSIQPELDRLTTEVSRFLASLGLEHLHHYYYSKLSFLRDLVESDAAVASGHGAAPNPPP
jgi:hypothetical protein